MTCCQSFYKYTYLIVLILTILFIIIQKAFKEEELSAECLAEVDKTFKIFDVDGSEEIDRDEALKHWKSSFGKLSAKEFFD